MYGADRHEKSPDVSDQRRAGPGAVLRTLAARVAAAPSGRRTRMARTDLLVDAEAGASAVRIVGDRDRAR